LVGDRLECGARRGFGDIVLDATGVEVNLVRPFWRMCGAVRERGLDVWTGMRREVRAAVGGRE